MRKDFVFLRITYYALRFTHDQVHFTTAALHGAFPLWRVAARLLHGPSDSR